jgi:methionine-S-sulfoxide reductase
VFIAKCLLPGILAVSIASAAEFPAPAVDSPAPAHKQKATAVLAGGCYWGVEAIFEKLKGISGVEAGFAKGDNSGAAGPAESVKISYDQSQVSYGQLLEVFFAVAHDPTELDRQGPDVGAEYRSVIFYSNDEQKRVAEAYIKAKQSGGVPAADCDRRGAAGKIPGRRRVPAAFCGSQSEQSLCGFERSAQAEAVAAAVSRAVEASLGCSRRA